MSASARAPVFGEFNQLVWLRYVYVRSNKTGDPQRQEGRKEGKPPSRFKRTAVQQVRRAKSRSKLQSQVLHDNRLCSLEEKRAEITERALYSFAKHFPGHFWTFQMDGRAARAQLCPSAVRSRHARAPPQLYLKCWATKEINNGEGGRRRVRASAVSVARRRGGRGRCRELPAHEVYQVNPLLSANGVPGGLNLLSLRKQSDDSEAGQCVRLDG